MVKAAPAQPALRLGVDLGGTKMHAVAIDAKGRVLASSRRATKAELGYRKVLTRLQLTITEVADTVGISTSKLGTIGMGMPGPIDVVSGVVPIAPNLGWKQRPVAADLGKLLGCRVELGNDVNFGALGEATYGAGAGTPSSFAAFVGTGLGGGMIIRNKLVNGAHGFAGEIGHLSAPFAQVRCGCGLIGCLEMTSSKIGITRLIKEATKKGKRCRLEVKKTEKLKSSQLRKAWKEGCPATRYAIREACRGLAWGLANIGAIADPAVFVLGGGVIEALGKDMLKVIKKDMHIYSLCYQKKNPDLRLAALGDDAVAIGAAVAAGAPHEVHLG